MPACTCAQMCVFKCSLFTGFFFSGESTDSLQLTSNPQIHTHDAVRCRVTQNVGHLACSWDTVTLSCFSSLTASLCFVI